MERLTLEGAIAHLDDILHNKVWDCEECKNEHIALKSWLEELKQYNDLEEQGKLIKLPCKVGDTVYFLWKGEISEMEVTEISVGIKEPLYEMRYINNATRIHFYEEEFGQTIFHTPEEAEAALKKMEGENENNN